MATAQVQLSSYRFSLVGQSLDGHAAIASRALRHSAAELVIEHDPVSELRKIGDRTHQMVCAAGASVQAQHRTPRVVPQLFVEEAMVPGPDETGLELEFHSWLNVLCPIRHKPGPANSQYGGLPGGGGRGRIDPPMSTPTASPTDAPSPRTPASSTAGLERKAGQPEDGGGGLGGWLIE